HRLHWGFDFWKGHNQQAWDKVKGEAIELAQQTFNQNQKANLWLRS
ncbi:23S rRNA m(2)G2445 methyltransferase, partial [Pasteurella multocida subsp. multocida str. Anand1_cattle]